MSDYGISASQEGIDLKDATDAQRSIDSRWKYMDIVFDEEIVIPEISTNRPSRVNVFEHNLGYLPAFDCYSLSRQAYISSSNADAAFNGAGLLADNKYIYFNKFFDSSNLDNTRAILRIYNVPITEEFDASIAETLNRSISRPSKYGVKILQPDSDNDISDSELSNFSLNTTGKALAIQKTGIQKAGTTIAGKLVITHNLGNPPIFMVTGYYTDNCVGGITTDFMPQIADADGIELIMRGAQAALSGSYAYIIFKEFADFAQ